MPHSILPRPDLALQAANERILQDTLSDQFVTVFYGILEPQSGRLTYSNAGHSPPYLFSANTHLQKLTNTGTQVGIFLEESWGMKTIQLDADDLLLLYTDGVTEAQNRRLEVFGEQRLLDHLKENQGAIAAEIQASLLQALEDFTDGAPRFDDVAIMALRWV